MGWDEYRYRVVQSRRVTPVVQQLELEPEDAAMAYRPGQYVLLSDVDFRMPQRSYSLANAPRPDGGVRLLVTRVPGGPTSCWVHDRLAVGETVLLNGPYGTFVLDPGASGPVLLLAAGSGLAPVRALAEFLLHEQRARPVTLFFSARTAADSIDHELLGAWDGQHPEFRYLRTLTRVPGAPAHPHVPDLLGDAVGDLTGWEVYASGPPGFVRACAAAAEVLGADPARIHTEEFFADPQPWTGTAPAAVSPEAAR